MKDRQGTIDITPTWSELCFASSRGALNARELMPACILTDKIVAAQKSGAKRVILTFKNKRDPPTFRVEM